MCTHTRRAQLSPLLTVIQHKVTLTSHFKFKSTTLRGLRGLAPAPDRLQLQGRVGARTPSAENGHPPQRLMTSAGGVAHWCYSTHVASPWFQRLIDKPSQCFGEVLKAAEEICSQDPHGSFHDVADSSGLFTETGLCVFTITCKKEDIICKGLSLNVASQDLWITHPLQGHESWRSSQLTWGKKNV